MRNYPTVGRKGGRRALFPPRGVCLQKMVVKKKEKAGKPHPGNSKYQRADWLSNPSHPPPPAVAEAMKESYFLSGEA